MYRRKTNNQPVKRPPVRRLVLRQRPGSSVRVPSGGGYRVIRKGNFQ